MDKRQFWCFVLLLGSLFSRQAWAAVPDDNAVLQFLDAFRDQSDAIGTTVQGLSYSLFYGLATIEFMIGAYMLAIQPGGADLNAFATFLIQRALVIGLFIFFLQNGADIATVIVQSFSVAATNTGAPALNPAGILDRGLAVVAQINETSSWFSADGLAVAIAGMIIMVLFGLLSAAMLVAIAYFRHAIASGFQIMLMQIIAGLGLSILLGWMEDLRNNSIEIGAVIGVTIVMYLVSKEVPEMAADMIRGTSTGSMSNLVGNTLIANSLKSSASTMAGAATSMANSASAIGQAAKIGASGSGSTTGGAIKSLGSAVAQDIGRAISGTQRGPGNLAGPMGSNMSQRVNNDLKAKNAEAKGPAKTAGNV